MDRESIDFRTLGSQAVANLLGEVKVSVLVTYYMAMCCEMQLKGSLEKGRK